MKPNPGILGLLLGTLCLSPSFAGQSPSPVLQPSRVVEGRELTSLADPPIRIRVRPGFRYVGGQRFILRDVADVEQHLFVETGTHNAVTRAFWIQFERLLPGRSGSYTYDSDEPIDVMGVSMRASVRRFTEPPAPDSDRWRAYNLVARAGLVIPTPATRVRLVHVPDADARQELMIVYIEPALAVSDVTSEERRAIVRRATQALSITQ